MPMGPTELNFPEIVLRLAGALACGSVIGLNRDLHHKGAGMRTFGLVALATAGVSIGALSAGTARPDDFGRLMQGVLTGIGFLGAGVILRRSDINRVTGLTTAAAIWFVAGVALLCGLGQFSLVALLMAMAFALLVFGRAAEHWVERWFVASKDEDDDPGRNGSGPAGS
jgi:putative Mg2+ transporter-C (MgtC) family protein